MEETYAQLGDTKIFSKLDVNSGLWQIKLARESALYQLATPFGHYIAIALSDYPLIYHQFLIEVFQRRKPMILKGIEGAVTICMMMMH